MLSNHHFLDSSHFEKYIFLYKNGFLKSIQLVVEKKNKKIVSIVTGYEYGPFDCYTVRLCEEKNKLEHIEKKSNSS